MPVSTATSISNTDDGGPGRLIDAIKVVLTALLSANVTYQRDTGTAAGGDRELWFEIPAAYTKNGKTLLIGLEQYSADVLRLNTSHLAWASASDSGSNLFHQMDGQPQSATTTNGTEQGTAEAASLMAPRVKRLDTGANYVRSWIITSPTFGNSSPADPLSLWMIVEVSTGEYLSFGFSEATQLGTWTTPAAGLFLTGTFHHGNGNSQNTYFCDSSWEEVVSGIAENDGPNVMHYADGEGTHDYHVAGAPQISFAATPRLDEMRGTDAESLGVDHLDGVSAFSGLAQRLPVRFYGSQMTAVQFAIANQRPQHTDIRWAPLAEIADVFFVNIQDLDPGTVLTDGGEKFLVVPWLSKTGGANSGNNGFLIRNAAL